MSRRQSPTGRAAGAFAFAVAALSVLALAGPARAATSSPPPLSGGASPCIPQSTTPGGSQGPCTLEPTHVGATWNGTAVLSLSLSWATTGRPKGAPAPSSPSAALDPHAPGACTTSGAQTSCSWPWPATLESNHTVLNGTYQLRACITPPGVSCIASPGSGPATIAIAAPPLTPTGTALQSGSGTDPAEVVSWSADPEPDVAGYQVDREGTPVWSCQVGTPAASGTQAVTCPSPPSATDHPGVGLWSYSVIAERYGASGNSLVASTPATLAPVGVDLTSLAPSSGVSQVQLPPIPFLPAYAGGSAGSASSPSGSSAGVVHGGTTGSPGGSSATATNDPGYSTTLPYGAAGRSATLPGADVAASKEPGPTGPDVNPVATFALGALVLALAVHLLYLRGLVRPPS